MSTPTTKLEKPLDYLPFDPKLPSFDKSWLTLATGIKATYWLTFCAISIVCILYPEEDGENRIIDDQWMSLQERVHTDDLFRIFDRNAYSQT